MSKKVKRLFDGFRPQNYQLRIDVDRDRMRFVGSVTIRGKKAGRPSQRLIFHQNGLKISRAKITRIDKKGASEIPVKRINHHSGYDEVRLHTEALLYPGDYQVTMDFSGIITKNMDGIYPCFFQHDGRQKKLIATQFESHAARQAFPCIDEPEAKATFDLTLSSPKNETVLSNTPIKSQETLDNLWVTTFETTPVMSSYLLAFAFGELKSCEATSKNGTLVRAFATPDNAQFTGFALDTAVKCLELFEEYFDIKFPLSKCDLLALPDFASGAMENWGLITFREQGLLVDPQNTSLNTKQYVAEVICHELTHQWFGNLVTMRWWTDLWLNEGFATIMAYYAVDRLFPEWRMMNQFIVEEQQIALNLDALANTHPVEVQVGHPDEIRTIFDTISYNKGSSVILMLWKYLGEKDFCEGLRHYLKTHSYKNTDTADLWGALESVSRKPVRNIMQAWTSQSGFPLVRVDVKGNTAVVSQEKFFVNPNSRHNNKQEAIWPITLNATESSVDILHTAKENFAIKHPQSLRVNKNRSGFYRTIYDDSHLQSLSKEISDGSIDPVSRLGILNDTFEASKSGYCSTTSALKLLEAYRSEENCLVWESIASVVASLRSVMDDEDLRESTKPYIKSLVAKQLKRLGWHENPGEPHFDTLLRPTIIGLAALAEHPDVTKEIDKRFADAKMPTDLPPNLRAIIYVDAARRGDRQVFDKLFGFYKQTSSAEERVNLASALTAFKQPEIIRETLDQITTDAVRLQDSMYWIAYSFSNRFARTLTWEWLKSNWQWLRDNLGGDLAFSRMPIYAAKSASQANFLAEYKAFFEPLMEPMIARTYAQGVEMIEWQTAWRKRDLAKIKQYFAAKNQNT